MSRDGLKPTTQDYFGTYMSAHSVHLLSMVTPLISSFFLSLLSFLWIGAQFPQEKFLSYGRILTLYYYFIINSNGRSLAWKQL